MRSDRATLRGLGLATIGLVVVAAGCSTVTPFGSINTISTGGQNYLAGYGTQDFPASEDFLEQAQGALDDVNVHAITRRREGEYTVFEGRAPKDHRAVVWVRPEPDGAKMHVSSRFGAFGDEALSRAFLDRLGARLRPLPGEVKADAHPAKGSPRLSLRANSADAPPGSVFQRRLESGVRELPYP